MYINIRRWLHISQLETILVECKDNREDCKSRINSFRKRYKNIVSVHETIPFKNPDSIRLKISNITNAKLGEVDFIIEVNIDKKTDINKILEQLKKSLPEKAKIEY